MNLKPRLVAPARIERSPSTALVPVVEPAVEKSDPEASKLDDYQIPLLFSTLLSDPQSPRLLEILDRNLQRARQREDELYVAIFEGVLAASRTPPDLSEAVRLYHRAFDLSEQTQVDRDGFLHSMAWVLFAGSSSNSDVSELLDRARSLQDGTPPSRETIQALREMPSFASAFEAYRAAEEDRIRALHRLVVREGRISTKTPLLLFPRNVESGGVKETIFRDDSFPRHSLHGQEFRHGGGFLFVNGFGTSINPELTFFDDFYRLGGSLREVGNVVLTTGAGTAELLRRFLTLYEILFREVWDSPKLRFFVTPDIAGQCGAELSALTEKGVADRVVELRNGMEVPLPGDGVLSVRQGSLHVKVPLPQGRWTSVQFLMPLSRGVDRDAPIVSCGVSVFAVSTPDDLYWAAAQVQRCRPNLALFDFPSGSSLWKFRPMLREFLGPERPFVPVGRSLICDVRNGRFLDPVKSYDSPAATGWSDYSGISLGSPTGSNESFYFDESGADRFAGEGGDIVDAFRHDLRRRSGLFFTGADLTDRG